MACRGGLQLTGHGIGQQLCFAGTRHAAERAHLASTEGRSNYIKCFPSCGPSIARGFRMLPDSRRSRKNKGRDCESETLSRPSISPLRGLVVEQYIPAAAPVPTLVLRAEAFA